jgi:hypothetical protein
MKTPNQTLRINGTCLPNAFAALTDGDADGWIVRTGYDQQPVRWGAIFAGIPADWPLVLCARPRGSFGDEAYARGYSLIPRLTVRRFLEQVASRAVVVIGSRQRPHAVALARHEAYDTSNFRKRRPSVDLSLRRVQYAWIAPDQGGESD